MNENIQKQNLIQEMRRMYAPHAKPMDVPQPVMDQSLAAQINRQCDRLSNIANTMAGLDSRLGIAIDKALGAVPVQPDMGAKDCPKLDGAPAMTALDCLITELERQRDHLVQTCARITG